MKEKLKTIKRILVAIAVFAVIGFSSLNTAATYTWFGGTVGSPKTVVCGYTTKTNSSHYTSINWYYNPSGVSMTMNFYETSLDGSTPHAYASTTGTSGYFYVSTTCIKGNGAILKAAQGGVGKTAREIGGDWEP
jgi:hypothetical protein